VNSLARKKADPSDSLARFMYGIYDYYVDRGMPQKTAKARMIDSTLEVCSNSMREEEDIPDHMMVLMAQWMSRSLNNRGIQITRAVKNKGTSTEEDLQPLRDIKELKDMTDKFIENYKGWNADGTEERS
jgi:adenylate kinase family enzyme